MKENTEFKLGSLLDDNKNGEITMINWSDQLAAAFEHLGLDKVFCVSNATWTDETHIVRD